MPGRGGGAANVGEDGEDVARAPQDRLSAVQDASARKTQDLARICSAM